MAKIFLNNRFVSLKNAKVSILDRGFLYGDGVFETMRAYNGQVFMAKDHIERLLTSLERLKIKSPYNEKKLHVIIEKTLRRNRLKEAYVKLIVTRGVAPSGIDVIGRIKPSLCVFASPVRKIPRNIYKNGIKLTFAQTRKNEESPISGIKSLNYLDNILARFQAKEGGFDEVMFLNTKGNVSEASTSNVFLVKNGVIVTPPKDAGLLPGVTRKTVIKIIKQFFNNKIYEKNLKPKDLLRADEVFLTNSILEIVPVVKLGRKRIASGRPGTFTRLLFVLYRMHAAQLNGGK
ncbi:MAG: aminotransferase class IV [Candidatus Omnitrophica bacterium]|nr:aminotransferase class IV [Candidatus Omnitrophota bacterium]